MESILPVVAISVLGPVIGSFIGVFLKASDKLMYNMLSFAAGVMLSISFLQLIPESIGFSSIWFCIAGVIIGALVMFLLDRLIPHLHPELCEQEQGCNLSKTSVYLVLGIFLHNLPEGMAMAIGEVSDTKVTFAIALAIAIHNIPEGICTSAPYYHCTGNRLKSFLVSSSTAIPVLIGFILARYIFKNISMQALGVIIGATAGLMIYICGDELIPSSSCKITRHSTIFSLICGVVFVIMLDAI